MEKAETNLGPAGWTARATGGGKKSFPPTRRFGAFKRIHYGDTKRTPMAGEGATTLMFDDGLLGRRVKNAKAGDRESFDSLMRAHQGTVLRLAQRLLVNSAEAQDAAQEVFLRLHRSLGSIDEQRALEPWLYRTTVNICHDLRRKRQKLVALELAGHVATRQAGPAETLETAERQTLFEQALLCLSDRERTAIVLRDLEGLPTAEVAGILGTTESTVRTQLASGRLKLKQWIQENYISNHRRRT